MKTIIKGIYVFLILLFGSFFFSPKTAFALDILINEIFVYPNQGEKEWVEFYNPTTSSINLENYYFDDDSALTFEGEIQKGTADPGSDPQRLSGILNPSSACFIELSSYLNNNEDTPSLFLESNNTPVDSYHYVNAEQGKSFSRIPDGGDWQLSQDSSKAFAKCLDFVPTPTFTPAPTSVPTSASVPTKTPTPVKIPTSIPTLKPTSTPASKPTFVFVKNDEVQDSTDEENIESPTSVLALTTEKASTPASSQKTKEIKSSQKEEKPVDWRIIFSQGLIGIGIIFILACAILAFRSFKKSKEAEE